MTNLTQTKSKAKKYQILSPDGFTIDCNTTYYKSIKQAKEAFKNWLQRYKIQGYYSSSKYGKIDLSNLEEYCQLITL
jgi:AAA+ superfamily predicted ATPase